MYIEKILFILERALARSLAQASTKESLCAHRKNLCTPLRAALRGLASVGFCPRCAKHWLPDSRLLAQVFARFERCFCAMLGRIGPFA